LAALCVVVAGARQVADLLAPVALAVTLVITVFPLHGFLRRRGLPSWISTAAMMIVLLLVLTVVIGSVGLAVGRLAATLPEYSDKFTELYTQVLDLLERYGVSATQVKDAFQTIDPKSLLGTARNLLSSLGNASSLVLLLLMSLLFLTTDSIDMPRRLGLLARAKPDLVHALKSFAQRVRRYWAVSTGFGIVCAVLDTIVLAFLGVPLPFTFGLLAFVTNYIPNVGFVIGLVPPALMALLDEGPGAAIWVIVAYSLINFVVQSIIQPRFTGDAVGLNATVTFLSLVFWAWVLGPLGALLAVPLTLFVKAVFIDRDPRGRWLNAFVSDTGS
jgi:predicted PurR-regulated permease PerM